MGLTSKEDPPQTISGPSVRGPVAPKQSGGTVPAVPAGTSQLVQVMPDLVESAPKPVSDSKANKARIKKKYKKRRPTPKAQP